MKEDNEDLVGRMEALFDENTSLRRELGHSPDGQIPGSAFVESRLKQTPRSSNRRTWEDLDERESTQASFRVRSAGQRSGKSTASSSRNVRYADYSDSDEIDEGSTRFRKGSDLTADRKSSNGSAHVVAFERSGDVINVPVSGSMRPTRSRVSTPFLSEESVSRITAVAEPPGEAQGVSEESSGDHGSAVNFDSDVHVVKVPIVDPGRSIRGRIATPFIKDIPTKEDNSPISSEQVPTGPSMSAEQVPTA